MPAFKVPLVWKLYPGDCEVTTMKWITHKEYI